MLGVCLSLKCIYLEATPLSSKHIGLGLQSFSMAVKTGTNEIHYKYRSMYSDMKETSSPPPFFKNSHFLFWRFRFHFVSPEQWHYQP